LSRGFGIARRRADDVASLEEFGDDELADAAGAADDENFRSLVR
jgi:hypothetical protein